ncbi:MAG: hypothetical protein WC713_11965 [Candidatus Methylomirabilota bacterium]
MARCRECNGTGTQWIRETTQDAEGTRQVGWMVVQCPECGGTGWVQTTEELMAEMEAQRAEGLGAKGSA